DDPTRRSGILGVAGKSLPSGAAGAHPQSLALVALEPLAADRVVDRAGRLGLLPGRVQRGEPRRTSGGDQPRRLAAPSVRAFPPTRTTHTRLRASGSDPVRVAV